MKDIAVALWLTWSIGCVMHLLRECWIIVTRGFENLTPCRRWWCPDGIKNRIQERGK